MRTFTFFYLHYNRQSIMFINFSFKLEPHLDHYLDKVYLVVRHSVVVEVTLNDSLLPQPVSDIETFFSRMTQSVCGSILVVLCSHVGRPKECCWSVAQPQH